MRGLEIREGGCSRGLHYLDCYSQVSDAGSLDVEQ